MHRDSLIQRRLDELKARGESIAASKYLGGSVVRGRAGEYVSFADTKGWGTSVLSLLRQAFGQESVHTQQFDLAFSRFHGELSSFRTLYAVFSSAKEDYEGGYIFTLRGLVKAEVLSDALQQADELLTSGYKDPACVLVGVSLEIAVKELASRHTVPIAKFEKMNADLCKAGAYNIAKQKQLTAWADLRNKAAHGDWGAYSAEDVRDMHGGVLRFLGDYL
jgi:hypothetical protein